MGIIFFFLIFYFVIHSFLPFHEYVSAMILTFVFEVGDTSFIKKTPDWLVTIAICFENDHTFYVSAGCGPMQQRPISISS